MFAREREGGGRGWDGLRKMEKEERRGEEGEAEKDSWCRFHVL